MTTPARQPPKSNDQRKRSLNSPWRRGPMCETHNAYQPLSRYRAKGKPT